MQLTLATLREADLKVRRRAIYTPDPGPDRWRSHAKQVMADPNYRLKGDCDDWASTVLHLLVLMGAPKNRLYRALVASPDAQEAGLDADHFIGIVETDDGKFYTVGDTFGPPEPANMEACRAGPHEIFQTSRVDQGLRWLGRGKLRRKINSAANDMRMSTHGLNMMKAHEGFMAVAYDDFRPRYQLKAGDKVQGTLTIGYGHTGPDVFIGQKITREQATVLLQKDVKTAENAVKRGVKVTLRQGQFDALCSFAYNCGVANLLGSTLLKKVNGKASEAEIMAQFRRWTRSKGVVMAGLVRRREDEALLWAGRLPAVSTAAGGVFLETARGDIVEPEPLVEEVKKPHRSVTLWLIGLGALAGVGAEAAALLDIADRFEWPWLQTGARGLMTAAGAAVFVKRFYEIAVEAKR